MTSRSSILAIAGVLATTCAASALAAPVAPSNMGAYCRGEAAKAFHARPNYVKSTRPAKASDGSATVNGVYEDKDGRSRNFECRYDPNGNFVEVKAVTASK